MVASLHAESQQLTPLATQSASGGSSSDQPLVPLQGSADVVQGVLAHGAAAITHYSKMPKGTPQGLFSLMQVPDRQALHMAAIDLISRRFRERMAGSVVANPVDRDRVDELETVTSSFVQSALGEDPEVWL